MNPYVSPSARPATGGQPVPPEGGEDVPQFKKAVRSALFIQIPLGILTTLVLDMGQTQRAFAIAMVCQWTGVFVIRMRLARAPTSLDLIFVRFGIIPIFFLVTLIQYFRATYC